MTSAKLIISSDDGEQQMELSEYVSIGRASDNVVCIEDPGVSRYHAVIEKRVDSYWLTDLGTINGTAVNGETIAERELKNGDKISIGDAAKMQFQCNGAAPRVEQAAVEVQSPSAPSVGVNSAAQPIEAAAKSGAVQAAPPKSANLKLIGAVAAIVVVIAVGAVVLLVGGGSDFGKVRIAHPQSGAAIRTPVTVRIEIEKTKKIDRVIYQLDGEEIASVLTSPYSFTLDPVRVIAKNPSVARGSHVLSVTIEDDDGNRHLQSDTIMLAFDAEKGSTEEGDSGAVSEGGDGATSGGGASKGIDYSTLAQGLASQISQKSGYRFDAEFIEKIRLNSNDYTISAIDDARRYRREIIKAFRDKGLHPLLGFVLAMSRSRFREDSKAGEGIGIWRLSQQTAANYLAPGETLAALNDPGRSAEIAASYMKDLMNVFGMDGFMYAIACYGMPLSQAGQIRARMLEVAPDAAMQNDFWKMVKAGVIPRDGAEKVARFFSAGIVGENPQAFGMNSERLSSLY